jgi:hypothetical protein
VPADADLVLVDLAGQGGDGLGQVVEGVEDQGEVADPAADLLRVVQPAEEPAGPQPAAAGSAEGVVGEGPFGAGPPAGAVAGFWGGSFRDLPTPSAWLGWMTTYPWLAQCRLTGPNASLSAPNPWENTTTGYGPPSFGK